jgi:hypothetical protein
LEHPERQVLIFQYNNLISNDNVYYCFAIMLCCDMHNVCSNNFSAVLVDDQHSILVTFPCMTYGVMMDSKNRNLCLTKQALHCPLLQLAQDMNINEIKNIDKKRNKRRLMLIFPDNVVLVDVF